MHIHADNLELSAGRGRVFGPLTFEIGGGLSVVRGDAGNGRTSLLLSLAGRTKPDAGHLTVGGLELPRNLRAVQRMTAVCGFSGIDNLEDSVTVGAALRERQAWISPWWSIVRRPNDVDVARICVDVFGDQPIPHADTVIWDLDETQKFLLRITLAMMNAPAILFVDDLEQVRSRDARTVLWGRLAHLATGTGTGIAGTTGTGTAVVVSASSLDADLWEALNITPAVVGMDAAAANAAANAEPTEATEAAEPELIKETV